MITYLQLHTQFNTDIYREFVLEKKSIMSDAAAPAIQVREAKKPRTEQPAVGSMVNAALTNCENGCSLAAIKKFIAAHYKVDVADIAPLIREYLKVD